MSSIFDYDNIQRIGSNQEKTILCDIMNSHLSDKGDGHHNYTKLYYEMFKDRRNEPLNILEIGIGSMNPSIPSNMTGKRVYKPGASMRGWNDFFPNAQIYACDIDRSILEFEEDRIHGFYFNQVDDEFLSDITKTGYLKDLKFDIIIDDGLHNFPVNCNVMKYLLPLLNKGGYYVIEDIIKYQFDYKHINFDVLTGKEYYYVQIPNPKNEIDNNLFIVHYN